jgi:FKBP-type peptidyl-prolyl cis-trans isomerase FklB
MKIKSLIIATAVGAAFVSCNSTKKSVDSEVQLKNSLDSVSYSIGISISNNLKQQGLDSINAQAIAKAIEDVYGEKTLLISEEQTNQIIQTYFTSMQEKKHEGAKKAGVEFLANNAKKSGVTTLPSGLQYEVVKMGDGPKPTINDKVKTHYHGTLIDGTVFDSSVERGEPVSFPVSGVIRGWTEALQLMPVGSKWRLYIPYDLAYGDRGAGGMIQPYAALVFDVELLGIEQ